MKFRAILQLIEPNEGAWAAPGGVGFCGLNSMALDTDT